MTDGKARDKVRSVLIQAPLWSVMECCTIAVQCPLLKLKPCCVGGDWSKMFSNRR